MFDLNKIKKNPTDYANDAKISDLVKLLQMLSDAYYSTDSPLVDDTVYDTLFDILKERDPKNEFLKTVNSVEVSEKGTKELVELPFEMGSLTKIKPTNDDLKKWIAKYKGKYCLSDKLDGVSAQIYKNNKGVVFMYSRGLKGITGQNITHLLKYVVDEEVLDNMPKGTSVRGELIISKKDFKKISDKMKNARNAVAGLVNAKSFDKSVANITNFVGYAVLNPRYSYEQQFELMSEWGFITAKYKFVKSISTESLGDYLIERRNASIYDIDGIVCFDDSKIYSHEGGYPEHGFAFKMMLDDQVKETTVIDVIWKASKDGFLKPTVTVEPIETGGVTIKKATGFNAKYIVDNSIGKGAIVKIVRSGDVIPYIYEVVKPAKKPQLPDIPYKWNETKVDIIVTDFDNSDSDDNDEVQQMKQQTKVQYLSYFFSSIGVKYLSEGIIKKFVENGLDTIESILEADQKKLEKIDGLGSKMIEKVYNEIDKAFENVTLDVFMGASNKLGRGFSEKRAQKIIEKYPNIIKEHGEDEDELFDMLLKLDGFAETTSKMVASNFKNFIKFYKSISKIKDLSRFEKIKVVVKNGKFNDKTFVFTGFRDADLEKYITDNGGKVSTTISGNTNMLIHKDGADTSTNKFVKAKEKDVEIISKSNFEKKYMK